MAFIVNQIYKIVMMKVFGTTKPKLLKFSAMNSIDGESDEDFYDPYFECIIDKKGRTVLRPRGIPEYAPVELASEAEYIKKTCYWMDESFFGMHVSNFMNKMFGAREVAIVEEKYTRENMTKRNVEVSSDIGDVEEDKDTLQNEVPNSSYKSRRVGIGFGPLIQLVPVIGNYIVLTINLWILYCMFEVGVGFRVRFSGKSFKISRAKTGMFLGSKDIGKMIFNIVVDFGIGLIPFVGSFVSIIHRSSSRNLAIFWKSMEKYYNKEKASSKVNSNVGGNKSHAHVL